MDKTVHDGDTLRNLYILKPVAKEPFASKNAQIVVGCLIALSVVVLIIFIVYSIRNKGGK